MNTPTQDKNAMGDSTRSVQIYRDAVGNTIITGDGNVVVIEAVRRLVEEQPPPTPLGPNPYKGLAAFDEDDAERFFGREALTEKLWQALRALHTPVSASPPLRLLAVVGPSGCGKSSVVRAGLLPELARRPLPGLERLRVAVLTPGAHPLEALATVLARIATHDPAPVAKAREFSDELQRPPYDGLRRIGDSLPGSAPLVVLVDQFEEAYALCQDDAERDAFVATLMAAAADRGARVSVVLTLRSDFLGATMRHPDLNKAITAGLMVPAMGEDELRRAIAEPARRAGHPLEEAVVERLLGETLGREGALPLLEFTLTRIWEGLAAGQTPAETLRSLGGVGGALAGEAERLFERLTTAQQQIARRAFLALVRLGEGVRDTRRRAILPEMVAAGERPEEVQAVLRAFAQAGERLVTLSGAGDEVCAEVTHEALFDHWTRLQDWLNTGRDDLRLHRRLAEAAEHWNKEGRPEGLLWRSPDLELLEKFQHRAGADMTALEVDFHRTSRARERARRRVKRVTVLTLVMLVIVVSGLWRQADMARHQAEEQSIIANQATKLAKDERDRALSRSLAAQASLLVERGQGEDAMLKAATLAVESWHRTPNPDAYSVATNLLQWFPVSRIEPDPGATSPIGSFAFSPDGRFLVVKSMYFIRLIETANNKEIWRIEDRNPAFAYSSCLFRFSADSRLLLINGGINDLNYAYLISTENAKEVFSVRTGEFTSHITLYQRGGFSTELASMSEDGRYLALTAVDSTTRTDLITIIDTHTGREACKILHPMNRQQGTLGVFFSPNGELLVIEDGPSLHLFEMPSGRERTRLTVSDASDGYFIGNGRWLVIRAVKPNDYGTTLHLFDPGSGRELSSIPLGETGRFGFSGDGQFMVTTEDNNNKVRLLVVPTGEERAHWQEKSLRAFFDRSHQWLVLVTKSGLIRLIDPVPGREKSRVKLTCKIDDVRLRSETDSLVVSCENGEVYTFKTSTGKETAHFKVDGRVQSLSPDGRLIATQDKDEGVLRFNETSTGREFGRVSTNGPILISFGYSFVGGPYAIFSSDSRYMAIPSPSGSIQLVELSQVYSPFRLEATSEGKIALSHDRRLLAFAGPDHVIRVIDITTGRQLGTLRHDEPVDAMAFSADGRFLTTGQKSLLTLSEIATGHEVARLQLDSDRISSIEISPDGNCLLINEFGYRPFHLITSGSLQEIMRFPITHLCGESVFSRDGRVLVVACYIKGIVQLFDTASGAERLHIDSSEPCCPQFSPDGQTLAVVDRSIVRLIDASTGTERVRMPIYYYYFGVEELRFSPDGRSMALVHNSGDAAEHLPVELFDVGTGKALGHINSEGVHYVVSGSKWRHEPLKEFAAAFSPDSRFFAVGTAGSDPVRLFEAATGKELASLKPGWGFAGVAFSPDGRYLAAASNNGATRLLEMKTLRMLASGQHALAVTHLEFSPDSRFLVTSGEDGTALMTETQTGKEIARFEHGEPITEVHFSPDGQSLLTISDKKVKLWPTDLGWPFRQLCARAGRNLSNEEWRTLIGESESWHATCPNWQLVETAEPARK